MNRHDDTTFEELQASYLHAQIEERDRIFTEGIQQLEALIIAQPKYLKEISGLVIENTRQKMDKHLQTISRTVADRSLIETAMEARRAEEHVNDEILF